MVLRDQSFAQQRTMVQAAAVIAAGGMLRVLVVRSKGQLARRICLSFEERRLRSAFSTRSIRSSLLSPINALTATMRQIRPRIPTTASKINLIGMIFFRRRTR